MLISDNFVLFNSQPCHSYYIHQSPAMKLWINIKKHYWGKIVFEILHHRIENPNQLLVGATVFITFFKCKKSPLSDFLEKRVPT